MDRRNFLLVVLTVIKIALSLPVEEKIEPVELKYNCITVTTSQGKADDKIPVLLIHGLTGSQKNWDGTNLHIALRTQSRVCSVDLRNHGDSPWNNRTDVKALVVDIDHFLDKQGMKKVNIIGHSLGGKVAVHYSLNNPTRVNSIVVEDMRPNLAANEGTEQIVASLTLFKEALSEVPATEHEEEARKNLVNILNQKVEKMGIPGNFTVEAIRNLELKQDGGKWRFKFNIDVLTEAIKDPKTFLGESSGLYTGPVLFIYGAKSEVKVGEDKDNILKLFPKAKLVPVEGAGHIIHGLFRKFDEEVVKFLNEVN